MFVALMLSLVFIMVYILTLVTHPVLMAIFLIGVAFFSSLLLGKLFMSWVFYLLLLVFLGGVMVALSFMVSICANEKFFYSRLNPLLGLSFVGLVGLLVSKSNINLFEGFMQNNIVVSLYQSESFNGFVMLMLVLVLCLISVVNISKLESGPLVKRL